MHRLDTAHPKVSSTFEGNPMVGVCKFCRCTDTRPCFLPAQLAETVSGVAGDTRRFPCAWLLPDVCSHPACVEKAYGEARLLAETVELSLGFGLIEVAA
jgi:hypothetical protein